MRTWTVEEAKGYVPRLRQLLVLIDSGLVPGAAPGSYALPAGSEHAEAALAELQAEGIVLRQVANGLVDFVWKGPGDEVRMLCYHVGEPELEWWHRPEDGYAGRRPIADITWPDPTP